jgi:alpha-1,3-fucosyltransferase
MALWPVSNCNADSKRQDYIKELRKYMSVDIYGKCGSHTCSRSNSNDCMRQWEKNYKFYIAFENNICEDYITEKLFSTLRYEMIPVVLGGGNYNRDAPPQSVINARDFNSPKALAEFLIRLAEDEQRYHSYFNWKSQFDEMAGTTMFFCK